AADAGGEDAGRYRRADMVRRGTGPAAAMRCRTTGSGIGGSRRAVVAECGAGADTRGAAGVGGTVRLRQLRSVLPVRPEHVRRSGSTVRGAAEAAGTAAGARRGVLRDAPHT